MHRVPVLPALRHCSVVVEAPDSPHPPSPPPKRWGGKGKQDVPHGRPSFLSNHMYHIRYAQGWCLQANCPRPLAHSCCSAADRPGVCQSTAGHRWLARHCHGLAAGRRPLTSESLLVGQLPVIGSPLGPILFLLPGKKIRPPEFLLFFPFVRSVLVAPPPPLPRRLPSCSPDIPETPQLPAFPQLFLDAIMANADPCIVPGFDETRMNPPSPRSASAALSTHRFVPPTQFPLSRTGGAIRTLTLFFFLLWHPLSDVWWLPTNRHRLPTNRHRLPTNRHWLPTNRHRRAYWTLRVFFSFIAAPPGQEYKRWRVCGADGTGKEGLDQATDNIFDSAAHGLRSGEGGIATAIVVGTIPQAGTGPAAPAGWRTGRCAQPPPHVALRGDEAPPVPHARH